MDSTKLDDIEYDMADDIISSFLALFQLPELFGRIESGIEMLTYSHSGLFWHLRSFARNSATRLNPVSVIGMELRWSAVLSATGSDPTKNDGKRRNSGGAYLPHCHSPHRLRARAHYFPATGFLCGLSYETLCDVRKRINNRSHET